MTPVVEITKTSVTLTVDSSGLLRRRERVALWAAVVAANSQRALELGTGPASRGGSTVYIVGALAVTGGHLISIDSSSAVADEARADFPAHDFVSIDSGKWLASAYDRFDFVFIDDDGTEVTLRRNIDLLCPLLLPGATVAVHDWPEWRSSAFDGDQRFALMFRTESLGLLVKL